VLQRAAQLFAAVAIREVSVERVRALYVAQQLRRGAVGGWAVRVPVAQGEVERRDVIAATVARCETQLSADVFDWSNLPVNLGHQKNASGSAGAKLGPQMAPSYLLLAAVTISLRPKCLGHRPPLARQWWRGELLRAQAHEGDCD
jgi:hypothetical protein